METKPKILIIDDEEVVLDSCKQILKGSGYQLEITDDGTRGVELVHEYQPDLVFVDLKMPGISGFEVLEKVDPGKVEIACPHAKAFLERMRRL